MGAQQAIFAAEPETPEYMADNAQKELPCQLVAEEGDNPPEADPAIEITDEAIRQRSKLIWEREGCPEGYAQDHWERARDELAALMARTANAHLAPRPEKNLAPPLWPENDLEPPLWPEEYLALSQCPEDDLVPPLWPEEYLALSQSPEENLAPLQGLKVDLAPPPCPEEVLAPRPEENLAPPSCPAEDLALPLCFEPDVAPPLCPVEDLAPPLCLEEDIAPPVPLVAEVPPATPSAAAIADQFEDLDDGGESDPEPALRQDLIVSPPQDISIPAYPRLLLSALPQRSKQTPVVPSIICAGIILRGSLESSGDIQFDGTMEGDVCCVSLVVGEDAYIGGLIIADDVIVRGRIRGGIRARRVHMVRGSFVEGAVHYGTLLFEDGAQIDGSFQCLEDPLELEPAFDTSDVLPAQHSLRIAATDCAG